MVRSVAVYLLDGSFRTVHVESSTTFKQLRDLVSKKLGLAPELAEYFAVFPVIAGYEQEPAPEVLVLNVADTFRAAEKMHKDSKVLALNRHASTSRFVFKKFTFSLLDEIRIRSAEGLRLLFHQAVHDVLHHVPALSSEQAAALAAVQMQVVFGQYASSIHRPGFLRRHGLVKCFIPGYLFAERAEEDWEPVILNHYAQQMPQSRLTAMRSYLATARRLEGYGGLFLLPCSVRSYGRGKWPGLVTLAVTHNRVLFIDASSRDRIAAYHFKDMQQWGADKVEPKFGLSMRKKPTAAPKKNATAGAHSPPTDDAEEEDAGTTNFMFKTPQGRYVTAALSRAVAQHMADRARLIAVMKQQQARVAAPRSPVAPAPATPSPGGPAAGETVSTGITPRPFSPSTGGRSAPAVGAPSASSSGSLSAPRSAPVSPTSFAGVPAFAAGETLQVAHPHRRRGSTDSAFSSFSTTVSTASRTPRDTLVNAILASAQEGDSDDDAEPMGAADVALVDALLRKPPRGGGSTWSSVSDTDSMDTESSFFLDSDEDDDAVDVRPRSSARADIPGTSPPPPHLGLTPPHITVEAYHGEDDFV